MYSSDGIYQPAPCIVRLLERRCNEVHKQPSLLPKSNGEVHLFGDSGEDVLQPRSICCCAAEVKQMPR